jgi:hypothetical protein
MWRAVVVLVDGEVLLGFAHSGTGTQQLSILQRHCLLLSLDLIETGLSLIFYIIA